MRYHEHTPTTPVAQQEARRHQCSLRPRRCIFINFARLFLAPSLPLFVPLSLCVRACVCVCVCRPDCTGSRQSPRSISATTWHHCFVPGRDLCDGEARASGNVRWLHLSPWRSEQLAAGGRRDSHPPRVLDVLSASLDEVSGAFRRPVRATAAGARDSRTKVVARRDGQMVEEFFLNEKDNCRNMIVAEGIRALYPLSIIWSIMLS